MGTGRGLRGGRLAVAVLVGGLSSGLAFSAAQAGALPDTVSVGTFPASVAITPDGLHAYVTNEGDNSVSVINTTTDTVTVTIPVGSVPFDAAVTPDGADAYVTNSGDNTVSVINTATNTVTATIPVGTVPLGLAVTPDGLAAYVTNSGDGTESVIDTSTNTVTATIPVGAAPFGVAISPDGAQVYVTNSGDSSVSVINTTTNTVTATVPVGVSPLGVAISPDGAQVYVANNGGNTMSVVSTATNTVTSTVTVGSAPVGVTVSPDGTHAYVTNNGANTMSVIGTTTNTVLAAISVGTAPFLVAVSPDGASAYVTNNGDNTVSVVSAVVAPSVTGVTVPLNATYVAGQSLDFTVNFSEAVVVTGTPRISITLDTGGTVFASYVSGSGTNTLTFRFTVQAGEQDLTGIVTGASIDLNGGTIGDDAGTDATLGLVGEPSTAGVDIDAIVPAVTSVAVPADGTYGTGQDLAFVVNFSKAVTVDTSGGTPYLSVTLDTGGTVHAFYVSGSGSSTLVFEYPIVAGQLDTNGITLGSSLTLNGGTIQDAIGNNAAPVLNSVASTTGVLVDAVSPTVSSIDTVESPTNNLSSDQFLVTFSTSVTGVDTSDFTLVGTGTVAGTIASVTGSGSTYTVTVTGVTGDGTLRLDLNTSGSAITDSFGNTLTAGHTGDQSYTIEHTPPSATAMTVPADGTYGTGQDLDFGVTFSEAVAVTGAPRLSITLDTGGTVFATYLSGSGTSTLIFRFAVQPGDQDLTGIVTGTSIALNSGTIRDAATNDAVLAVNAVEPSTAGIDVDAIAPVVVSVGVPANATYIAGQDLDFTVNLNKNVTVDTTGGTPYVSIGLTIGGTVHASYISGSGTSSLTFRYVVAPGNQDLTGVTVGASLVLNGATIQDSRGNQAALALAGVASTTGVLVDAVPPVVTSIATIGASTNNNPADSFTVTFSKAVTGVDVTDFTLTTTGMAAGTVASVSAVTASSYTVTVDGVTGQGTLRLDLDDSGTGITDLATNPIDGGFTGGQSYTVGTSAPFAPTGPLPTTTVSTATSLSSSPNQPTVDVEVTYRATVTPAPDGGTVTFTDGGTTISGCGSVRVSTSTGVATCDPTYQAPGSHTIGASYSGDATFASSAAAPITELILGRPAAACPPAGTDTAFVCHAYEDLLSRAPTAAELASYLQLISAGANRTQVAHAIVTSTEYRRDLVASVYQRFLGRAPDPGGLATFMGLLGAGATDEQFMSEVVGSAEFFDRAGATDPLFVRAAYTTILGRTPDPEGSATFLGLLGSGQSRTQVAYDLLTSTENRLDTIASGYEHLLARPPSAADLATQVAYLGSGGTVEQLISNIVGSPEFYSAPAS